MVNQYPKAAKYPDLGEVYAQVSGPGGLKLAEFLADKMDIQPNTMILDVGMNRGYQTCFLAKEYQTFIIGIDPWDDRTDGRPHVEHLRDNAKIFGVEHRVLGVQVGVPDTQFATGSFDAVYTSTALEMLRGIFGEEAYLNALKEIYRVLKPGGILGLAEPMHLPVEVPAEIYDRVSIGDDAWTKFFATIDQSSAAVREAGFTVLKADYAPDAYSWWTEFAQHDPFNKADHEGEPKTIALDGGRWLSVGYIIAKK